MILKLIKAYTLNPDHAVMLPVSMIISDGKADGERVALFAANARALEKPLIVIKHGASYAVLDGHHRLEAAKLAGRHYIPAMVAEDVPCGKCNGAGFVEG